jgi:hypothetical protein
MIERAAMHAGFVPSVTFHVTHSEVHNVGQAPDSLPTNGTTVCTIQRNQDL